MARVEERAVTVLRRIDPATDGAKVERGLADLAQRSRRRVVGRTLGAGLGAIAVAAAVYLVVRAPPSVPAEVAEATELIRIEDGSTVRALGAAEVEVREQTRTRVRVVLAEGDIDVSVTRRPERRFIVESGPVRVVVLGTRFEVHRLDRVRSEVRVERGHVRVEWTGGSSELVDGEGGVFPPDADVQADSVEETEEQAPEASTSSVGVRRPRAASRPRPRPEAAGDWRSLAREGGYAEAYALLSRDGTASVRDDVGDLMLAADAARLSGHTAEALPFLERVVSSHASDSRAPMAAFTRGRLLMSLGRPAEAASTFERTLALGADGSLHEHALARAVEAHDRAGHARDAARLAAAYEARYPDGRWLAFVRARAGTGASTE